MELMVWLNERILGPAVPVVILAAGLYFMFRLRGFIFLHPLTVVRGLWASGKTPQKGISPFRAMTLALAGTLGVGNIVGVASAIYLGGPGAIFWMMISALLVMYIKYSEIVLAMGHRKMGSDGKLHGGAMYYLPGRFLPVLFAVICLFSSLGLGNFIQVKAAADALHEAFSLPHWLTGGGFALLTAVVIAGGVKSISDFTQRLIPMLSLLYILLSMAIILPNMGEIPGILAEIIRDAFNSEAVGGGIAGFVLNASLRYGVSRGILSNEAGCGTAPIAHAEADNHKSPAEQGFWGIFEVFADTILLCSMTALVILLTGDGVAGEENGMLYALNAYQYWLGDWAVPVISLSAALFALATVICWAHYGMESLFYLTPRHSARQGFTVIFILCTFCGAVMQLDAAWIFSDIGISLMALLNTGGICFGWREAAEVTEAYFFKRQKVQGACPADRFLLREEYRYTARANASKSSADADRRDERQCE